MPIPDDIREHYPDEWQSIREWLRERTKHLDPFGEIDSPPGHSHDSWFPVDAPCCEWCGVPELDGIARSGRFWECSGVYVDSAGEVVGVAPGLSDLSESSAHRLPDDGWHETDIVLTVAHPCHDPRCTLEEHLAVLCQACHLDYDRDTDRPQRIQAELRGQEPIVSAACRGEQEEFEEVPA